MNIQSNYGIFAYHGASKVQASPVNAPTPPAISTAPSAPADKVTISAAAQSLAEGSAAPTQARTPAQEQLLKSGASDPQTAEKLASDMAHSTSQIFYNLNLSKPGEPLRLSTTGQPVDDAFKDKFATEASKVDAQRLALYNSEKTKGTDPQVILSKMVDLTNMQSQDYLNASGWAAKSA